MRAVGGVRPSQRRTLPLRGRQQQVRLTLVEQREPRAPERAQPLSRGGAGTQRGRTAQQLLLEGAVALPQQREGEPGAVAEAAVHGPHPDARRACDVLHRDAGRAARGEQLRRGRKDPSAVRRRVGALGLLRRQRDQGELLHRRCIIPPPRCQCRRMRVPAREWPPYWPGSFTTVTKNSSIWRTTSMKRSKSTGLVTYALACSW
jgi:hypothetical protein